MDGVVAMRREPLDHIEKPFGIFAPRTFARRHLRKRCPQNAALGAVGSQRLPHRKRGLYLTFIEQGDEEHLH